MKAFYEKKMISGRDVYVQTVSNEDFARMKCYYYDDGGLLIRISGVTSEKDLSRFITELKP